MRGAFLAACAGVLAAASCSSKKSQHELPPAAQWSATGSDTAEGASDDELSAAMPPPGMFNRARDPHAGLDTGDPSDPHAGLDMSDPSDPHAGLDMTNPRGGTDVTKLGLAAPDPDRPIDPSHRIAGTLAIAAKLKDRVKPGTSVFLLVKRAGADGAPTGPPLAVDKLTWTGDGMAFELTEEQAMVAGTDLTGSVVVTARYDQDSDALTKEPGDVTGQVRTTIPAERVVLTLDTLLP